MVRIFTNVLFVKGSSQKVSTETNGVASKAPAVSMTLGDLIRTEQCYDEISKKTTELLGLNFQRRKIEVTILDLMTQCVNAFDPKLRVHPFGSAAYGLCGPKSNYNILIDTRRCIMNSIQFAC